MQSITKHKNQRGFTNGMPPYRLQQSLEEMIILGSDGK